MSDYQDNFGGTPFAMGELHMLRTFDYQDSPYLRGEYRNLLRGQYGMFWRPGVNIAVCERFPACSNSLLSGVEQYPEGAVKGHLLDPEWRATHETTVQMDCKCGFYGYWSPGYAMQHHSSMWAVVRMYGTVVMGPFGARASRAEVVAVTEPLGWHNAHRPVDWMVDEFPWAAFEETYPGVAHYETLTDLLEAHPLTPKPPELEPATSGPPQTHHVTGASLHFQAHGSATSPPLPVPPAGQSIQMRRGGIQYGNHTRIHSMTKPHLSPALFKETGSLKYQSRWSRARAWLRDKIRRDTYEDEDD